MNHACFALLLAAFLLFGCVNGGSNATPTPSAPEATPEPTPEPSPLSTAAPTPNPLASPTPVSLEKCTATGGFACGSFSVQRGGNLALAVRNLNESTVRITGATCATKGAPQTQPFGAPIVIAPGETSAVFGSANSCCGVLGSGEKCTVDVALVFTVDGASGDQAARMHVESVAR